MLAATELYRDEAWLTAQKKECRQNREYIQRCAVTWTRFWGFRHSRNPVHSTLEIALGACFGAIFFYGHTFFNTYMFPRPRSEISNSAASFCQHPFCCVASIFLVNPTGLHTTRDSIRHGLFRDRVTTMPVDSRKRNLHGYAGGEPRYRAARARCAIACRKFNTLPEDAPQAERAAAWAE